MGCGKGGEATQQLVYFSGDQKLGWYRGQWEGICRHGFGLLKYTSGTYIDSIIDCQRDRQTERNIKRLTEN